MSEALGHIIPRMTEAHWAALAYVEKYGLAPQSPISSIAASVSDLLDWGLITEHTDGLTLTTDLGDEVLDEQQEALS
jgi:hypothetical protein